MMKFPEEGNLSGQSDMMWQKEYGSYFIEKHIIYPEPYSALPFLVMIPKFASEEKNILSYLIVQ